MTDELGLTAYTDLTYAEVQAIQAKAWKEGYLRGHWDADNDVTHEADSPYEGEE